MRIVWLGVAALLLVATPAVRATGAQGPASDGLVTVASPQSVDETTNRLQSTLQERGLIVVARVDHAANARTVSKELRPTQLLIFGNPAVGTELMQSRQTVGIDLPQKFLVWEDENGQVQVTYNDPRYLAQRHGVEGRDEVVMMISNALAGLVGAATAP